MGLVSPKEDLSFVRADGVPRSVFLDFGGTLCRSRADLLPVFREAAERAGTQIPEEAYLRANEECWDEL